MRCCGGSNLQPSGSTGVECELPHRQEGTRVTHMLYLCAFPVTLHAVKEEVRAVTGGTAEPIDTAAPLGPTVILGRKRPQRYPFYR